MRMTRFAACSVLILASALPAFAQGPRTQTIEYEHDGVRLKGYLARPAGEAETLRPAVLVVHEWWGLNDYAKKRAQQLAELGYVAFAVDMYGEGKTTDDPRQAGEWAGALYGNRELHRARVAAGVDALESVEGVDHNRIAAIGYCFGGTTVLELAYSGADVDGVVSFHGGLKPPAADDNVSGEILICHGAADPLVPQEDVLGTIDALSNKDVPFTLVAYSGAKHSFTSKEADTRGIDGIGYQQRADEQSWEHMKTFLADVFAND